jgi:hypothetical protein
MWNIYKTVGLLAVICLLAGPLYSVKSPSADTESPLSNAVNETRSEPTTEVKAAPSSQDPFKKFLDEKSSNPSSSVKPIDVQVMPTQAGKDPFKEFLEKQKQNSKDQVVSPFGKN